MDTQQWDPPTPRSWPRPVSLQISPTLVPKELSSISPPRSVPPPPGYLPPPPPPPPPQPPPLLSPAIEPTNNLTVKSTISQDRTKGKGAFRNELLAILQEHSGRNDEPPLNYPGVVPPNKYIPGRDGPSRPPLPPSSLPPPFSPNELRRKKWIDRSRSRSTSSSPPNSPYYTSEEGTDTRRRRRRRGKSDRYNYGSASESYVSSHQSDSREDRRKGEQRRPGKATEKTPNASPRPEPSNLTLEESKQSNCAEVQASTSPPAVQTSNPSQPPIPSQKKYLEGSELPALVAEPRIKEDLLQDGISLNLAERMRRNVDDLSSVNLYDDSPESRLFGRLLETIKKLELEKDHVAREFRAYRRGLDHSDGSASESEELEGAVGLGGVASKALEAQPKYEIQHTVECDDNAHRKKNHGVYRDQPALYAGDESDAHLEGKDEIKNPRRYLEANKNIVFVVSREHLCRHYQNQLDDERDKGLIDRFDRLKRDGPKAQLNQETIRISNNDLVDLLNGMLLGNPELFLNYPLFDNEIPAPYNFFYHHRAFLEVQAKDKEDPRKRLLVPLLAFVKETYEAEWDEADALFASGQVTKKHLSKLYRPGEIVISRRGGKLTAYEVAQWPRAYGEGGVSVACTNFMFHGYFFKSAHSLAALPPLKERLNNAPFSVDKLEVYPLKYCPASTEDELIARGRNFWSVRNRSFICYNGWDFEQEERFTNTRFMIDFMTYKRMHPRESSITEPPTQFRVSPEDMVNDEPRGGNFVLLLPANMYGFNVLDKKWYNLSVDRISPIQWNKKAFERLVVKPKIKELIKALVSVHVNMGKSADIVTGKGNGLIVLLHGGPGTGKTLTAESVAELAEKPLYRVTCGDIGTNPEAIEKYLETVLYIGELWGCVVLLDEADVFLEERSLADLERNAMVSVFLRVLEYYEGILILTSNRVGTFDEAFKSRIQLALHYPNLSEGDRRKIWSNFIKTLDEVAENVDLADLEDRVDDLARHKMNGRQIRNAVTTARQLAQYRKQTLDYGHFEHVISTMVEFDQYLEKTHRHTDDQWAREEGVRY